LVKPTLSTSDTAYRFSQR